MTAQLSAAIGQVKGTVKGRVLCPDDAHYDDVRQIWNATARDLHRAYRRRSQTCPAGRDGLSAIMQATSVTGMGE